MLPRRWRDPRLFPALAAPVMGALALVEARSDAGFRPHFAALALVAGWLVVAFLVQCRLPSTGAVLVAGFYPLTLSPSAHPGRAARV